MPPKSSAAVVETVLAFIKGGNLQPASKPGFGHALKLSYNLMAKEHLTVTNRNKTLSYRYKLSQDVPKATVGLYTALMDELSTNACFAAGLPSPPGVSLQMQTELLVKDLPTGEIDIVNTVTKLGKTVSHTRTDFICATTQQPVAFSSHVKYMPTGSRFLDFLFTNKRAYSLFSWFTSRKGDPPSYPEKNLFREVIGLSLEYTNTQRGRFHIARQHTNPFGAMHGGCHAMVMEEAGASYAKAELGHGCEDVLLEAMQIDFIGAAKGTVDVVCETIGKVDDRIHVRVMLQKGGRICSEGKLRFSKK